MTNAMSIDLEDWFCVQNLSGLIPRGTWDSCEFRAVESTRKLLRLFRKHDVRATFFVLGWVGERAPDLLKEVQADGHEIASHGYFHRLITEQTPEEFEADLLRSLDVIHSTTSEDVLGYRAPSFTVVKKTLWALDILKKHGIRYDSSIFPIGFHPDYGMADAPLARFEHPNGLTEFPLSVVELAGKRIPVSGGGYFRLMPYPLTRLLMKQCNNAGRPVIFYLHPWELDPGQPRQPLTGLKRFRHYNNLNKTEARLERLLCDFTFQPIREFLPS